MELLGLFRDLPDCGLLFGHILRRKLHQQGLRVDFPGSNFLAELFGGVQREMAIAGGVKS